MPPCCTHAENYLRTHDVLSDITLTPGEINWLYDQMCGDHVLEVSIVEFFAFIKSFALSHGVSDQKYPVVDIKVSHNQADEDKLEKLHYHRIPENLNIMQKDPSKTLKTVTVESVSSPIYLWFRTGSVEDYKSHNMLLRARITDVVLNSDKDSHKLYNQGFRCIDKSLTSNTTNTTNVKKPKKLRKMSISGSLMGKNKNKTKELPTYLWIRRNWRDPNPVLNIAMTSGRAKNLNDKIHFPPFAGFKLTEPMHNLSGTTVVAGGGLFFWSWCCCC